MKKTKQLTAPPSIILLNSSPSRQGAQIDSSTAAASWPSSVPWATPRLATSSPSSSCPSWTKRWASELLKFKDKLYFFIIIFYIKVDPAMMAALMSACSMIQTGASTEEVSTHTICALDFFLFFSLPVIFFFRNWVLPDHIFHVRSCLCLCFFYFIVATRVSKLHWMPLKEKWLKNNLRFFNSTVKT